MEALEAKARRLGADDFGRSRAKKKRFFVIYQGKKINFGLSGGRTFIDHQDKKKRKAWLARHEKIKLKDGRFAHKDPRQASYWSKKILWP